MLSFRYHSTNCFFVRSSADDSLLAIDAGWPGTLHEYARSTKVIGCRLQKIRWAFVTHFHMDHAGLIGRFIELGNTCFVFEKQDAAAIDAMERTIEKNDTDYRRIEQQKLVRIDTCDSRKVLQECGVMGRVMVTNYHSPDSVTFISDKGEAIIGDLPSAGQMMPDDRRLMRNWQLLRDAGAIHIYPSHAEAFRLEDRV